MRKKTAERSLEGNKCNSNKITPFVKLHACAVKEKIEFVIYLTASCFCLPAVILLLVLTVYFSKHEIHST